MPRLRVLDRHRKYLEVQLSVLGADMNRLEFLRWLVEHRRNPEWPAAPATGGRAKPRPERN
ncbi:MAG: hypothetical protein KGJ86_13385 [Chloroflexota bacterium]|nr:hypothetical protein [Chloroflexota bacterium]